MKVVKLFQKLLDAVGREIVIQKSLHQVIIFRIGLPISKGIKIVSLVLTFFIPNHDFWA